MGGGEGPCEMRLHLPNEPITVIEEARFAGPNRRVYRFIPQDGDEIRYEYDELESGVLVSYANPNRDDAVVKKNVANNLVGVLSHSIRGAQINLKWADRLPNQSLQVNYNVIVYAGQPWQPTGMYISANDQVVYQYLSGLWTVNPAYPACDAAGVPGHLVRADQGDSYPWTLVPERTLIGGIDDLSIPTGPVLVFLGDAAKLPAGYTGQLEVVIDDDLFGKYGAGLSDNSGSITISLNAETAD